MNLLNHNFEQLLRPQLPSVRLRASFSAKPFDGPAAIQQLSHMLRKKSEAAFRLFSPVKELFSTGKI